jgi:hypothetical protein
MRIRVAIIVIVPIVGGDRGGGVVSESRAGIDSTDRRPISGCTSSESVVIVGGLERRDKSKFGVVGGKSGSRGIMFGSSGMRWSKTESKSNLGFRLGKAFTLLIRSKTDRRHPVVLEDKL